MEEQIFKTPGQLIAHLIESKGWTKKATAAILGIEEAAFSRYASDKRPITADVAVLFEEIFGVAAEDFLALQQGLDLAQARYKSIPDPKRAVRATLLSELPVQEMVSRNWIRVENAGDISAIEQELKRFFGTTEVTDISSVSFAAKRSDASESLSLSQLAWLRRVRNIAKQMLVTAPYSQAALRSAIQKMKPLLAAPVEARNVPRLLSESGVRFVVVEALKSSKIDGVCFWLDDGAPVVGLTMRFDRMDNFWFVLRHELEHVLCGHGKQAPILDVEIDGGSAKQTIDEEEALANAAAAEFCAPQVRINSFIARKAPLFPERDFLGLVKVLGVHPALVAGQIRNKTGRYELFSKHIAKIRADVLSSAIVDGWGNVAPVDL